MNDLSDALRKFLETTLASPVDPAAVLVTVAAIQAATTLVMAEKPKP